MSEDCSMLLDLIRNIFVSFERIVNLFIQNCPTKTFAQEIRFGMCWAVMVYFVVLVSEVNNPWLCRISPCHLEARLNVFI